MRSKRAFAAVLVVLAMAAGACGGGSSGGDAGKGAAKGPQVVLLAADKTAAAGSSKIAMAADVKAGEQTIAMTGEGVFDYAKQLGSMTFKLSGDEIPSAFSSYEIRFIKTSLYMKFPDEFSRLTGGKLKEWIRLDLEDLAEQAGFTGGFPGLGSFTSQDPTSALAFVRGAKDVKEVGVDTIRGARSTHYSLTVEMDKAIEQLPKEQQESMRKVFGDAGITELPMDVWIDGEGRARRIKFAMDLSKLAGSSGAGAGGSMTITMDLFDFGVPVSVSAPPADQVSDYEELQKLGEG